MSEPKTSFDPKMFDPAPKPADQAKPAQSKARPSRKGSRITLKEKPLRLF